MIDEIEYKNELPMIYKAAMLKQGKQNSVDDTDINEFKSFLEKHNNADEKIYEFHGLKKG